MPSLGSRVIAALARALQMDKPLRTAEASEAVLAATALRPAKFGPPKRLPRDIVATIDYFGGWPVYTLSPRVRKTEKTLVYVHGGGYVFEINFFHWNLLSRIAAETNTRVVVPIYPVLPRGNAEEVVATVAAITLAEVARASSEQVSLGGDSAGGQIAMSVALEVRDAGAKLRRIVLIHPVVDLTLSNRDIAPVEQQDPFLRVAGLRPLVELWRGALDASDPRVSPLFGDFHNLGPLSIFSGTHDITNPDTRLLVIKARQAGVEVDFFEGEGLIHPSAALPTREGREARRKFVDALR